jgi:hypothetical protein
MLLVKWFSIVFQFVTQASDPNWACSVVHRDPGLPGTYYLYCAEMSPDDPNVELITVGKFVSDPKPASEDVQP